VRPEIPDDAAFDDQLPAGLQVKASLHFTPVAVARHAARLLAPEPGMSVLDVGAGAGKFCITAALEVPRARFVGVEWRPHLVRLATRLARAWAASNTCFVHGDAFAVDWSAYDAFYLFNPFEEQLFEHALMLDRTIELEPTNYFRFAEAVRRRLAEARLGTRVVTYHGFGASPPAGYVLASTSPIGTDCVQLWIKTGVSTSDHEPRVARP
jgi:SAM-dependent methyltransferase